VVRRWRAPLLVLSFSATEMMVCIPEYHPTRF
jgi:hypothetical protein